MLRPLAALLLVLPLAIPAATADWAAFHADAQGTGWLPVSSYPLYQDVWWNNKTLSNAQVHASPVIKDGILIITDLGCPNNAAVPCPAAAPANAGLVRALDVESGHELWHYYMASSIEGTPAISGERVYVVDTAGDLKALNLRNGACEVGCTTPVSVGPTLSSIREDQGVLFIGTEAGEMKAYYESTLTLLWTFSMSSIYTVYTPAVCTGTPPSCTQPTCTVPLTTTGTSAVRGAAAIVDGLVIFGSFNHYVVAIDEHGNTGAVWIYKTGDIVTGAPSVIVGSPNHVTVGSYDGNVYDFTTTASGTTQTCSPGVSVPPTNTPVWTFPVPTYLDVSNTPQVSKVQSSPANSGDKVYVGANNGHFYALTAATGALAWEQDSVGDAIKPVTSSPAVANGFVVVGSQDKSVYWLSASNGSILKSFSTSSAISTSPAIDGNRAIVSATDGTTYMFGPKVPPRPDLVVASVGGTATGVSAVVKNQGAADAPAGTLRFFLDGTFLADVNVSLLPAGQQATVTAHATLNPGTHTVKASADWTNTAKESNESNNDASAAVTIAAPTPVPTAEPSTTKKSPAAGLLVGLAVLGCAATRRRRAA